jgi:putative inorganic carbon (HCO3(-)) transporter
MKSEIIDKIILGFLLFILFLNIIFPGEIYFVSAYLTALIAITLFFLFFITQLQKKIPLPINCPYKGLFIALILLLLISTFHSINYHRSRGFLFLFLSYTLIFFLLQNIKIDTTALNIFYKSIFVVTILIAIYGFYQYFFGFGFLLKQLSSIKDIDPAQIIDIQKRLEDRRIFSTFALPTSFGGFLAIVMPLVAAKIYSNWHHKKKRLFFYIPLLVIYFSAMIATGSFGALVSLVSGALLTFLLLFYNREEFKRFFLYIFALAVVLALSLFILAHFRGFALWDLKAPTNPIVLRLDNWKVASKIAVDYPVLGAGLGSYGVLYPEYMTMEKSKTQFAHNTPLQLAGEIGWLGTIVIFLLFLLLLYSLIKHIKRALGKPASNDLLITKSALLVSSLTFAIHNLVEINLYFHSLGLFGIMLFSLLVTMSREVERTKKKQKKTSHARKVLFAWIILIFFITISIWITRPFIATIYAQNAEEAVENEDYQTGLKLLTSAIKWDSNNSEFYSARAKIKLISPSNMHENLDSAIEDYRKAIQRNPYAPRLHFELSELYLTRGWITLAYIEAFEAKRLYPLNQKYFEHVEKCRKIMEELKFRINKN